MSLLEGVLRSTHKVWHCVGWNGKAWCEWRLHHLRQGRHWSQIQARGTKDNNRILKSRKFLLCTWGASYALFISLLIFNLCCTKACMDGGRGGQDKVNSLCPANLLRPGQHILPCFTIFALCSSVNSTFLGPNGTPCARWHFRAHLDFQGPPLPMALEMDVAASKPFCPAPYKH